MQAAAGGGEAPAFRLLGAIGGVTGVQGTVKAEPLTLINGHDKLSLRFDCKPCEMHVVGKIRRSVLNQARVVPMKFHKTRPGASPS